MEHIAWIVIRWIFYILPDFLGYVLAAAGLALMVTPDATKSLEGRPSVRRTIAVLLLIIGIGAVVSNGVQKSQASAAQESAQRDFQNQFDKINQNFQTEQIQHTSDVRYLEGKLDAFAEIGPGVLKLAQASELNTRKQYDEKALSNKELRDFVSGVVKKMRDWEYKRQTAERELEDKQWSERSQLYFAHRGEDPDSAQAQQFRQELLQHSNDESAAFDQMDLQFQQEFRANILGDAVSARDQLMARLGASAEPQLGSLQRIGLYVFQGIIVGPYPVANAADYLEQFAKKLSP
jgi:hypothetical protein